MSTSFQNRFRGLAVRRSRGYVRSSVLVRSTVLMRSSVLMRSRGFVRSCMLVLACVFMLSLSSCYKDPRLTPGTASVLYDLPQGNHPYDTAIVNFYNTYGSFILYKWTAADFLYGLTGQAFGGEIIAYPADTNYVAQGMSFLHANLLDLYPAAFLKQTMPWRILLGSQIDSILITTSDSAWAPPNRDTILNIHITSVSGFRQITFCQVDSALPGLSAARAAQARGWLNSAWWQQAIGNKVLERPDTFDTVTDYNNLNQFNNLAEGVLVYHTNGTLNTAASDFVDYIQMITSTNYQQIDSTWFSPQTDTQGRIKEKYNIIVQYYLSKYGVDLQAIGNLP